jgi:hypothetical protein
MKILIFKGILNHHICLFICAVPLLISAIYTTCAFPCLKEFGLRHWESVWVQLRSSPPRLREIRITLFNEVGTPSESRAAEASIRNEEANSHPNHPDVFIKAWSSLCLRVFRSKREHKSTSERVTNESCLGLPARFELDRARAQSKVLGKIQFSKQEYPVSQTGWSGFGRFGFRQQRAPAMKIGPTST